MTHGHPSGALHKFKAEIQIIGINPFVFVPPKILVAIFKAAGKKRGSIPIAGTINGVPYTQTLVRYSGEWRLYINTTMLKNSPKRIGEKIELTITLDTADRTIATHPKFLTALTQNKEAKKVFDTLRPSTQNEIVRYIAKLKTEESIEKNITRAIDFLLGKTRFIGRDRP